MLVRTCAMLPAVSVPATESLAGGWPTLFDFLDAAAATFGVARGFAARRCATDA